MDPNYKDLNKKIEEIIEKKIMKTIKEKELLGLIEVVTEPPFTKELLEYPNLGKLKPPAIDSFDGTKDPIDHVHTFQLHMHYV